MIGQTISHYEILEELGGGGMGVVYKARDRRLDRLVAIKFLTPHVVHSEDAKARFDQEARAASALDHKNICTVHEIDETADGRTFIVMAYYDGGSLAARLEGGPLPLADAVDLGRQVAEGLAAAHERGLVHRDVKPANVMLAGDGQAKLVDFGLAKLEGQARLTKTGSTLGTVAYMAPEQARGEDVDARADVFSLGAVLYEMLTGRPPFRGGHEVAVLDQVLNAEPEPVSATREDVPPELERLVADCLQKDPSRRITSAQALSRLAQIGDTAIGGSTAAVRDTVFHLLRRPSVAVPLVVVLMTLGAWGYRSQHRRAEERWARAEALPRIKALLEEIRYSEALHLARQVERVIPDDQTLRELIETATVLVQVTSEPPGAAVSWRPYLGDDGDWVTLGETPIEAAAMPWGHVRFRVELEGYDTFEGGGNASHGSFHAVLTPADEIREGMVRIPAGVYPQLPVEPVPVGTFWIDRFEVTNAEFQVFVDRGRYGDPSDWPQALTTDAGSWEVGIATLEDATGRPGPAGWELGRHPEGRGAYPVHGVSWYEAVAYCTFAGKRLPTLHHWWVANGNLADVWGETVVASNFGGVGPAPVGAHEGIGGYGTYDMAGNVAEWVWTEGPDGSRYVLGGAWADPGYAYRNLVTRQPSERPETVGFRCAHYAVSEDDPALAAVDEARHDFRGVESVSDETFEEWRTFYEYDPLPLDARVESARPGREQYRRELVSYAAAYDDERILAHVFLPTRGEPPYQAVVYSPTTTAYMLSNSDNLPEMGIFDFIPSSGRVFVYPVYKGTYERKYAAPSRGPAEQRRRRIRLTQDLSRTVDYLEEREDIDGERLAYLGLSAGSEYAASSLAIERRFKAAVWVAGGYDATHMQHEQPFVVPWNYAPRVTTPVLMINGRGDYALPVETGQKPLFDMLGTPSADKKHVLFDGGHLPQGTGIIRETLDWLDRYLGPVTPP